MNSTEPGDSARITYPPGFRARRGLNWGFLGLLYTSFYMCRYNLSIANGSISREYAFSRADMGAIISTALLAYAAGQIINGLLTDRIGGKKAMLIGAGGTIMMNILFGAASMVGFFAPAASQGPIGLYAVRPKIAFVASDIADARSLAAKLYGDTNAVTTNLSFYIRLHLPQTNLDFLAASLGTNEVSTNLSRVLATDLNYAISGPPIYDTNRFAKVPLSRGATNLLASEPTGANLVWLNHTLLDEAYPQEIKKLNHWLVHIPFFHVQLFLGLLWLFVAIRGIDGYLQAFGAPGMIRINTAWFAQRERGRFAGIFGFMINLGRFGIFNLGPALLAGFTFLWMWRIPPLHWRWLFWVPSGICAIVAVGMALTVKETPEAAGFHNTKAAEPPPATNEVEPTFSQLLWKIITHPTIWFVACAYACTGAVRQAVDLWFPRYMQDMYHMNLSSEKFQWLGFLIPFVASAGSLTSGYVSDIFFKGRRAPVAAGIYFLETALILLAAQFHSVNAAITSLVLISLTANSTHSILGTAAAMDIGGRKNSGFVSGVIDSFQYLGGSLAGYVLGKLLDRSLGNYFYFMAPFGLIGGILMVFIRGTVKPKTPPPAPEISPTK
ncbi:MAG TPA: MFS transporter [Verrucomicrobiae bacterium]|jgi:OPA family glycerol-3-phosphate transporter-like MFS transporter|nr:MFS transporter [Verrucomicrobiae bacterium]